MGETHECCSQNPFGAADPSDIDLTTLVNLRFQHQTKQAFTGVRTSNILNSEASEESNQGKKLSERQRLQKEYSSIIREQGDRGVGTGLERSVRWTRNPAPGGRNADTVDGVATTPITGNAANAAAVATAAAKRVGVIFEHISASRHADTLSHTGVDPSKSNFREVQTSHYHIRGSRQRTMATP